MIRVLIVDDDKLVRKGLMSAMPWADFDMEIIGEANNGEKALEFLESHPVDLLLTDLAMPVMSGIELMRIARQRYPSLHIVVLTLHQDFDFIQEALRLGAIDYIAKVELEKEQFEEVLGRIAGRIKELKMLERKSIDFDRMNTDFHEAYVLVSMDRESNQAWPYEIELKAGEYKLELERNNWIWVAPKGKENDLSTRLSNKVSSVPEGILLTLSHIHGFPWKEIQKWVSEYIEKVLFYEFVPGNLHFYVSMKEELPVASEPKDEELNRIKNTWLSSPWSYNDSCYERFLEQMQSLRMRKSQLAGLLYSLVMEWNHLFANTNLGKIPMIHSFNSWYEVKQWMDEIRRIIRKSAEFTSYSQEIVDCVKKAVLMLQHEMSRPLTASKLSQELNISRSYFSQCFKDMMGQTFNEYSRSIRIEKSKEYLLNTNNTILWIAEQTGYADEKYFSRTFRQLTGMLPSEYRQVHRKDNQTRGE